MVEIVIQGFENIYTTVSLKMIRLNLTFDFFFLLYYIEIL